jgi:hypothetical protein
MGLWRELVTLLGRWTRRRAGSVVASRPSLPEESDTGVDRDDDEPFFPDPVEIPITDSIDLHYFPPSDVGEIVDAYLEAAAERGLREVRIIHGRGRGVQRHRVRIHLERSPHVESFADAPGDRGGWGATLARLRVD